MKHLYAEFTARPGAQQQVAGLVAAYADQVRAETGCLAFDPFVRTEDKRRWVVFEAYVDDAAFGAHMTTEHNRRFNAEIVQHIEGGTPSLVWLTAVASGR